MKQIQPNIYITHSKKLVYKISPLKKLYPPNGLTIENLLENNKSKRECILTIYRNLIRLSNFLQFHKYVKESFKYLVKLKIRQDYNYRKFIFLPDSKELNDREIFQRLINTVNFIHNACLDSVDNKLKRPISLEFKILDSILQFENSKKIPMSLKNSLTKSQIFTLKNSIELRKSERAWNMDNGLNQSNIDNRKENIWWLENGLFKNEICFDYLIDLKNLKPSNFNDEMVKSMINFEKCLVLLNEESKLLL